MSHLLATAMLTLLACTRSTTPAPVVDPAPTFDPSDAFRPRIWLRGDHACALGLDGTARCWGTGAVWHDAPLASDGSSRPVEIGRLEGAFSIATLHHAGFGVGVALIAPHDVRFLRRSEAPRDFTDLPELAGILRQSVRAFITTTAGARLDIDGGGFSNSVQWTFETSLYASDLATTIAPACRMGGEHVLRCDGIGPLLTDQISVVQGFNAPFACALGADGRVHCWGDGRKGQLGDGSSVIRDLPSGLVRGVTGAKQLALGADHGCARLATGKVRCWGRNDHGQLGTGDVETRREPSEVSGLDDVEELAADADTTCARRKDESVWCWGDDSARLVGQGRGWRDPGLVAGMTGAVAIGGDFVGVEDRCDYHSPCGGPAVAGACALTASGEVWCWGNTDATGRDRSAEGPRRIEGLPPIRSIPVTEVGLGLDTDGNVWEWNPTPKRRASPHPAKALVEGMGGTCVLGVDGAVRCRDEVLFARSVDADADNPLICSVDPEGSLSCADLRNNRPFRIDGTGPLSSIRLQRRLATGLARDGSVVIFELPATDGDATITATVIAGLTGVTSIVVNKGSEDRAFYAVVPRASGASAFSFQTGRPLLELPDTKAIVAFRFTTCRVDLTGGVQCFGDDSAGQAGSGLSEYVTRPVKILP